MFSPVFRNDSASFWGDSTRLRSFSRLDDSFSLKRISLFSSCFSAVPFDCNCAFSKLRWGEVIESRLLSADLLLTRCNSFSCPPPTSLEGEGEGEIILKGVRLPSPWFSRGEFSALIPSLATFFQCLCSFAILFIFFSSFKSKFEYTFSTRVCSFRSVVFISKSHVFSLRSTFSWKT